MIIIGYPGVGKSVAAEKFIQVIDFESHNAREHSTIAYCILAETLSKQGYIVCVSSHPDVINQLVESTEQIYICYPSIEQKDQWVSMLRHRYMDDNSKKNLRAMKRVANYFDEDIKNMKATVFDKVELQPGVFLSNVLEDSFNHWEQENTVPNFEPSTNDMIDVEEAIDAEEVENDTKDSE